MSRLLKLLSLTLTLAVLILITSSCASTGAQVRLINAIPDSPAVDVYVNGTKVFKNVPFGGVQPNTSPVHYQGAGTGNVAIQGYATDTTANPISPEGNVTFTGSTQYTLIAVGLELNDDPPIVFADNNLVPVSNNLEIRIINVSPSSPTAGLDVYFVTPGTDITSFHPQITALGYGQASPYEQLPFQSAGYSIIFTANLSKIPLITQTSNAATGSITTMVILDNPTQNNTLNGMSTTPLILNDLN
jgi:hypothetical protein